MCCFRVARALGATTRVILVRTHDHMIARLLVVLGTVGLNNRSALGKCVTGMRVHQHTTLMLSANTVNSALWQRATLCDLATMLRRPSEDRAVLALACLLSKCIEMNLLPNHHAAGRHCNLVKRLGILSQEQRDATSTKHPRDEARKPNT